MEPIRIKHRPVRRTVKGYTREVVIGGVVAKAEMQDSAEGPQVAHAVFPMPTGGVGVVARVDDDGTQWLAAPGFGGWLPGTFDGIHEAVRAALEA